MKRLRNSKGQILTKFDMAYDMSHNILRKTNYNPYRFRNVIFFLDAFSYAEVAALYIEYSNL